MKYTFGDIVVVEGMNIGVVLKCWTGTRGNHYNVYNRMTSGIQDISEDDMERYLVRHKFLNKEELEYQFNAVNNL